MFDHFVGARNFRQPLTVFMLNISILQYIRLLENFGKKKLFTVFRFQEHPNPLFLQVVYRIWFIDKKE